MESRKQHSVSVSLFPCDFSNCHKSYKTKYGLKRHYISHLGVRPHLCEICGKRFALFQYLSEHLQIHKRKSKTPPQFTCQFDGCKKRFRNASNLSAHQKIHSKSSEISESSEDLTISHIGTNCTFETIEAVFTQINSLPFPDFFYTRMLPIPEKLLYGTYIPKKTKIITNCEHE